MLLIAFEHLKEAQPFLEYFHAKKEGELFTADDLLIFVNYGQNPLNLCFSISKFEQSLSIDFFVLIGLAGNLSNLEVNDTVIANRVKLLDTSFNPVYNPVDLLSLQTYKNVDLVTVLSRYAFDVKLDHFGDCIDKEGYFFAKFLQSNKKKGIIVKVISDNNTHESLSISKIDYSKALSLIKELKEITKINLIEPFIYTGITNIKTLLGLKKLSILKHLTFTMRQNLYKKIKINLSKPSKPPFKIKKIFCEIGLNKQNAQIINDYVSYFHNLKDRTALIYAQKKGEFLRKTPDFYTPNGKYGYSILQSYNCIYDCAYCFLKGYFRGFNPVIFTNIENYLQAIDETLKKDKNRPLYFYLGTFSDPIALLSFDNSVIEYVKFFKNKDAFLEIRTKSVNIKTLMSETPSKNIIIAYSLASKNAIKKFEFCTPPLEARLKAVSLLDKNGYQIGIRFDPFFGEFIDDYKEIVDFLSSIRNLHSIEIGFLRFSQNEYKRFLNINPSILKELFYQNGFYIQRDYKKMIDPINKLLFKFKDKVYYSMIKPNF